jgi:hypothetical protein
MSVDNPHPNRALDAALDSAAREQLAALCAEIAANPAQIRVRFPAAARLVGRGPLDPDDPQGLRGPTVDDAVRGALLGALARALRGAADTLTAEIADLYRFGDADERRAVLHALAHLPLGDAALPLVNDALRTNDARLVAAAMGPYGGEQLDREPWRQGVLKCLFVGVPLAAVAGLHQRADGRLAEMVAAFAYERVAAGRDVPADAWLVLDRFRWAVAESGLPSELDSPYPDRRAAAERALGDRSHATKEA